MPTKRFDFVRGLLLFLFYGLHNNKKIVVHGLPRYSKTTDLILYNNITGHEFCVDRGLADEETCAAAHVLVPNDVLPDYYGSPRKVKCCQWDSEQETCTSAHEPDNYCVMGIRESIDRLFLIYVRERLVGERGRAIRVAIQIILRIVGLASFLGSAYIIYSLAGSRAKCEKNLRKQPRSRTNVVFHRLFLGLSISDALSSFMFFLASWMIPTYEAWGPGVMAPFAEELYYDFFPWASGTLASCRFQGVVLYFWQVVSVSLTGAISLQYVLTVVMEWSHDKMLIFEKAMYAWSLTIALVTVIVALAKDAVGATVTGFCWISTNPWYCSEYMGCSEIYPDWNPQSTITEFNIKKFVMALVMLNLVIVVVSMVLLYRSVRKQEKRASRYSHATAAAGRASKMVVYKAILLIGSYLVVYIPAMVCLFLEYLYPQTIPLVMVIFLPCQGIFNALVYSDKLTRAMEWLGGGCCFSSRRADNTSGARSSSGASSQQNSRDSSRKSAYSLFGKIFRRGSMGSIRKDGSSKNMSSMTMTDKNSTGRNSTLSKTSLAGVFEEVDRIDSDSNPLVDTSNNDAIENGVIGLGSDSPAGADASKEEISPQDASLSERRNKICESNTEAEEIDASLGSFCERKNEICDRDEEIGPPCYESNTEAEENDCCAHHES